MPEADNSKELSDKSQFQNTVRTGQGPHFSRRVPDGDDRDRLVCDDCGHISYENPKIVVGAVCTWQGKVLIAKRDIPPRRGYWTIPAGYMELGETASAGAAREVLEEACAEIKITDLLAIYELPHISQVHMIYRGEMLSGDHAPGLESQETRLVNPKDIPWEGLAYPSVHWALQQFLDARETPSPLVPFGNGPEIPGFKQSLRSD
ncbi:MAG: NUDIX domain-containing protein [Rhodospirillaceae bacterium]